jgi:hypothetical protein
MTTTITTPLSFYSAGWKNQIPILLCCVLNALWEHRVFDRESASKSTSGGFNYTDRNPSQRHIEIT